MSRNYEGRERDFEMEDEGMPAGRPAHRRGGGRGGMRPPQGRPLCVGKVEIIDFKDVKLLQNFIPERGKILPRRISGVCTAHQRMLAEAIKRARNIALLPYTAD